MGQHKNEKGNFFFSLKSNIEKQHQKEKSSKRAQLKAHQDLASLGCSGEQDLASALLHGVEARTQRPWTAGRTPRWDALGQAQLPAAEHGCKPGRSR